jgi:hypothetical protein
MKIIFYTTIYFQWKNELNKMAKEVTKELGQTQPQSKFQCPSIFISSFFNWI